MKKYILFPLLFISIISFAQQPAGAVDIAYDLNQVTCDSNPNSLIGQELYFFPRNQMFQGGRPEKDTIFFGITTEISRSIIPSIPKEYLKSVKKNELTVLDVYANRVMGVSNGDTMTNVYKPLIMQNGSTSQLLVFTPYSALEDKLFKIMACRDSTLPDGSCDLKLTLSDPNGDILHWSINSFALRTYTVCFKGYIKYLRANFLNKKVYIRHENWVQPFFLNPLDGIEYDTKPGTEFLCTDVTIFNTRDRIFPHLAVILNDSAQKPFLADPGNQVIPNNPPLLSIFCTKEENDAYEIKAKKIRDSLIVARDLQEKQVKKKYPAYTDSLIKKYGKDTASYIIRGEVVIGMTKEMCIKAWGNYHTTLPYTYNGARIEVWGYSLYRWLRFNENRLVWFNE